MVTDSFLLSSPIRNGRFYFQPDEIIRLEAKDNYTSIYLTNKRKLVVSKVLKVYNELLVPFGFIRTHRAHMINKQHIQQVMSSKRIMMKDDSCAKISRRQIRLVKAALNLK